MSYSEQVHYLVSKVKELADKLGRVPTVYEFKAMLPRVNFKALFGSYDGLLRVSGLIEDEGNKLKGRQPKILVFDIETKPIKAWCWGLWDQNISLDMIIEDWSILSWAAKWVGIDDVLYQDLSQNTDFTDDELIVRGIWELLNECDVIITQNGAKFDEKKLNAKFAEYGLGAPLPYKHIDALKIKKRKFGLTSNKLEYSTHKFNEQYKKLKHGKFPGMSLWLECLRGNQEAWAEMKEYNIHDVLALEELYLNHLRKWDSTINYGVYTGVGGCCPNCGSVDLAEFNFAYTKQGAFKSYQCNNCKSWCQSKQNELPRSLSKNLMK